MLFESCMTWEKLTLEIELLILEESDSMLPLVVGANLLLDPDQKSESLFRKLNFMAYELTAQCKDKTEEERLEILNQYFFTTARFQIKSFGHNSADERDLLIQDVIEHRSGDALPIALIYLHFARHLDLPIYLINLKNDCTLKWVRSGRSEFIDLTQSGLVLNENELIQALNKSVKKIKDLGSSCLDILPCKQILQKYLFTLKRLYERTEHLERLLIVLNILLKMEPSQLKLLSQRALLQRDLGLHKEALADIKRYFSFTNKEDAPAELKMAYYELMATKSLISTTEPLLH